jgi:uncharacterized protein involved in exopolysaccharide biosynthesis
MTKIAAMAIRHWQPLTVWNLLVMGATATTIIISPRIWTAKTQLIMPETNKNLDANLGILGSVRNSDVSSSKNQQIKIQENILTSDILLEKVL